MFRLFHFITIALLLLSCQNSTTEGHNQFKTNHNSTRIRKHDTLRGKVIKIADGDTFTMITGNHQKIKIRLHGIDSPERGQAFYQKAKQRLAYYVFGKMITVVVRDKDRYRRIVGDVYVNDTLFVNLQMIADGYAWHFKKYSSDQEMAESEILAQRQKAGLWADAHPIPPWEWRKAKREKSLLRF